MAGTDKWITESFENSHAGINSAVSPELIQLDQLAWGINIVNRGAKPATRPPFRLIGQLPSGLMQGCGYFGVQGGMGVVSILGRIYRLRFFPSFGYEEIGLEYENSGAIKQVWMQPTVESMVIQDGQSNAIIYNGSSARRAGADEVPRGRMMAYGNGRLWVAINRNELVAGDIRTRVNGSELLFTETNYLSGGGALYFSEGITALAFQPVTGTSDYGTLMVFGPDSARSIRADITQRDLWADYPGFVTNILNRTGCAGDWSISEVNQDLYWRDSGGGIRSIRSSLADESGPGNSPISREVRRLTDYDTKRLLGFCSSINFDNRLLMLSSPFLNVNGGVSWKSIIPLDFSTVSTMRGKTAPSYDGQWSGLNIVGMFSGEFNRTPRAFAISTDDHGANTLWEILTDSSGQIADTSEDCGETAIESPITCAIEYGRRTFGSPKERKKLRRMDVFLEDIQGEVTLQAYWRCDNNQKWSVWEEDPVEVCATMTDSSTEYPHVWKNLLSQQRPQIKTFTIPTGVDRITKYGSSNGFELQVRLVWTGKCRIEKSFLYADILDTPTSALRTLVTPACVENDVTGEDQQIVYRIPVHDCLTLNLDPDTLEGNMSFAGATGVCDWMAVSGPDGVDLDTVVITDPTDCNTEFILPAYGCYGFSNGSLLVRVCSTATFSYSVACRSRSGSATLCGFSEFTDPSTPPKKYKRRITTGDMLRCIQPDELCSVPACTGTPPLLNFSIEGGINGWHYTATAAWIGWNSGTSKHKYQLTGVEVTPPNPCQPSDNCVSRGTFNWGGIGIPTQYEVGDIFEVDPCTDVSLGCVQSSIAGVQAPDGLAQQHGLSPPSGFEASAVTFDDYDEVATYDPDNECTLSVEDNGARLSGEGACVQGGSPDGQPPPIVADPPQIVLQATQTGELYSGEGCFSGDTAEGDVTRTLDQEDTEQDAIERVFPDPDEGWTPWRAPGSAECAQPDCCESGMEARGADEFSFSFSEAQFRVLASGLDVSETYQVKAQIYRRIYGSSAEWELFETATYSLDVEPDGTAELIEDIEAESGIEAFAGAVIVIKTS